MNVAPRDAIRVGDIESVDELFNSGIELNQSDEHGVTTLMLAAQIGNRTVLCRLLSLGAVLFSDFSQTRSLGFNSKTN